MRSMTMSTVDTNIHVGVRPRALNIALWVLQVLLAAVFLAHGVFMVAPPAEMVAMINAQLGSGLRLFIGVAEVGVWQRFVNPIAIEHNVYSA